MNKETILINSGTNWTVSKRALSDDSGNPSNVFGIYRDDNNLCLGTVSEKYEIFQNSEALDILIEAAQAVNIKTERGGLLDDGKKVYYQFPLEDVTIGGSNTKRFLTSLTSHDGSSPIGFGSTTVTVSCLNTFFRALKETNRIRHTKNFREKLADIVSKLRGSLNEEEMMIEKLIQLSNISIPANSSGVSDEFLHKILGGDIDSTRTKNRLAALRLATVTEMQTHGETAYAVFNAVTRYTNHMIKYAGNQEKREALIKGTAYTINNTGYNLLVENYLNIPAPQVEISTLSMAEEFMPEMTMMPASEVPSDPNPGEGYNSVF